MKSNGVFWNIVYQLVHHMLQVVFGRSFWRQTVNFFENVFETSEPKKREKKPGD